MASVRRKLRSPYWFACYYDVDGKRAQRSTKQRGRKKALVMAERFEKAAKLGSDKRLGEAQARRILAEIYEAANEEVLPFTTARKFLQEWPELRRDGLSRSTYAAYRQTCRDFLVSLGGKADRDISQLTRGDVVKFRDEVAKRTTVGNANKMVKYVRVALGAAWRDGLVQENVAAKVDRLSERNRNQVERRPFTLGELKTIIAAAEGEWKGIILAGLFTGQRLSDVASLCWNNVDTENRVIRFSTSKTNRRMEIPIAAPLLDYLQGISSTDNPAAPLFSRAYPLAMKKGGESRLSQQFHSVLVAAGLAQRRTKKKAAEGRNSRRKLNEVSFHSLRHTTTSLLKNAGVPEAVVMDIIGHDTEAMSRHYTHIEAEAKRSALSKLPDILRA
jgi:integrase